MKKDERLERAFEEYFDGVTPPSEGAPDSAKNYIDRKARNKAALLYLLIALICVAAIAVWGILIVAGSKFIMGGSGMNSVPGNSPAATYSYAALDSQSLSPYGELPEQLTFAKALSLASNSDVTALDGFEKDGITVLYRAEVTAHVNGRLHDSVIYAESCADVCEELSEFRSGSICVYNGITYRLSRTTDNGEHVARVFTEKDGVRYYVEVKSSDMAGYEYYLRLIFEK